MECKMKVYVEDSFDGLVAYDCDWSETGQKIRLLGYQWDSIIARIDHDDRIIENLAAGYRVGFVV